MILRLSLAMIVLAISACALAAQDAEKKPAAAPADSGAAKTAAVADFQKALGALKQVDAELQKIRVAFQTADAAGRKSLELKFEQTLSRGKALYESILPIAEKAFAESPGKDAEHTRYIISEIQTATRGGDVKTANRLLGLLFANGFESQSLRGVAAMTALTAGDYEAATAHLKKTADANGEVPANLQKIEGEIKARIADAKAGDLPIIKMETTKGEIVIELFEKEAPNTVANFISLVEKKFYDGVVFHRVIDGFMAQGGDPTGTGSGGPGYNIPCECYTKNYRKHFAGSLSMAHAGKDTGGSQFFLTFGPTDHLDGKHTVFGRVIKGLDVLAKLQRINPGQPGVKPDKMTKVTVVRKRDHAYVPKTTPGR